MKPYSTDLRKKVVEAYENKEGSMRKMEKRFNVSLGFVRDLVKLHRETGSVDPKPHGGGAHLKLTAEVLGYLKEIVTEKNDAIEDEIVEILKEKYGVEISRATVGRGLRKLKWSRKKNVSRPEKRKSGDQKRTR